MQSEDFLNLFTLNSLTPRNVQTHQQQVDQQNADILKRINMLLGDSLDLNNLNFNVPMFKDSGMSGMSGQNSFTGTDLITNYPTLAGLSNGINGGGQGLGYHTTSAGDAISGMVNRSMDATPIKPCRAIRGDQTYARKREEKSYVGGPTPLFHSQSKSSTPADERRLKERMYRTPTQKTSSLFDEPIFSSTCPTDKQIMPPGMKSRSSPTDSDTSGISSDTSALSESYLIDLMNSLTISPTSPNLASMDHNANDFYRQQALLQNANYGDIRFPGDSSTTLVSPKLLSKPKITDVSHLFMTDCSDPNSIERAARLYRSAALSDMWRFLFYTLNGTSAEICFDQVKPVWLSAICEATCTWSGQLPLRINQREPIYSCKVFLGGIPWDITEAGLERCFKPFGPVRVEWPGKDGKHPRFGSKDIRGYAYLLFESDKCVKALLDNCSRDVLGGEYYYKVPSKRLPGKKVQVIPWILSDSNYVCQLTDRLDTNKTVFVGALHGMINAEALATIMNDLFGDVIYAGIDLDKHKYPIGSGRVTFSTMRSYMKAVCAAFVEVKTLKFTKTIDPYLEEDTLCQNCNYQKGRFFCRDQQCFRYYCQACWQWQHTSELLSHHKPLMRYKKNNGKDQQNQCS